MENILTSEEKKILLYRQLLSRKDTFDWKTIQEEELRRLAWEYDLSDQQIANLYNVNRSAVKHKRVKFGLQYYNRTAEALLEKIAADPTGDPKANKTKIDALKALHKQSYKHSMFKEN